MYILPKCEQLEIQLAIYFGNAAKQLYMLLNILIV